MNRRVKIYYDGTSMEYIFTGTFIDAERDLRQFCQKTEMVNWFAHISDMTGSTTIRSE